VAQREKPHAVPSSTPGKSAAGCILNGNVAGDYMGPTERGFQSAMLLSRWLLAPFLVGLALCLLLLIYRFCSDFYEIVLKLPTLGWHDLVVEILNLVDLSLTANLLLIVIFSGYENFIRKLEHDRVQGWPDGLTDVDFGALKQKLLGSIVVIAAVDALAWYLDLEKYTDTSKLGWALAFPLMLVLAMLLLAIADRIGRRDHRHD
jgi:uncharacterized protein (TIGR00645 family)